MVEGGSNDREIEMSVCVGGDGQRKHERWSALPVFFELVHII